MCSVWAAWFSLHRRTLSQFGSISLASAGWRTNRLALDSFSKAFFFSTLKVSRLESYARFVGLNVTAINDLYNNTFDDVYWHLYAWEANNPNARLESTDYTTPVWQLQSEVDNLHPKPLCCTVVVKKDILSPHCGCIHTYRHPPEAPV